MNTAKIFKNFSTNELINMSDDMTEELKKIQDNFDHITQHKYKIDKLIKEQLNESKNYLLQCPECKVIDGFLEMETNMIFCNHCKYSGKISIFQTRIEISDCHYKHELPE